MRQFFPVHPRILLADEFKASVRVTNLSDDATQQDLQELFRPFGRIARISVPRDRVTQMVHLLAHRLLSRPFNCGAARMTTIYVLECTLR